MINSEEEYQEARKEMDILIHKMALLAHSTEPWSPFPEIYNEIDRRVIAMGGDITTWRTTQKRAAVRNAIEESICWEGYEAMSNQNDQDVVMTNLLDRLFEIFERNP